ncbi:periplasmic protease [Idiomarina sp. A28L]|uniref:S41 family peptidase n=1 Tax=Idiomarina sp. A28L TaxID=1036674 RepID=UPI0002138E80|nr:S41 family peptidase [Idiomarina sp. A28L]EGN76269.1 periplasmic protease [Idiomarina sp. A28L]
MFKSFMRLGVVIIFLLSGCQSTEVQNSNAERADVYEMSEDAIIYLSTGFEFIQNSALERENVDWNVLREEVFREAYGAIEVADTYPALRMTIARLDDQHSYLHTSRDIRRNQETVNLPRGEQLSRGISLLAIPTHVDQSYAASRNYILVSHRIIREEKASCGWVIDLRGNRGGNQDPMIVSLAPFLPKELDSYVWSPSNGVGNLYNSSFAANGPFSNLFRTSKRLPHYLKDKPVAVLIDGDTGSSGESTLLQFLGRPNTKVIGSRTSGASTNIRVLHMSDGAILGVADSYFVDRRGEVYRRGIEPDIEQGDRDAVDVAIAWLGEFHQCL